MAKQAYIIGLTGNIASGKSVVRQMLQNYGALTIDADLLARRAYEPGAPAYDEIIAAFGTKVLDSQGQIDRKTLGQKVFTDPDKLKTLESIVHPYTLATLEVILHQAPSPIIVLEMIKLFEIGLEDLCDSIWVCTAPDQIRVQRLIDERKLSLQEALARLNAQAPQAELVTKTDYEIQTDGTFTHTWEQVRTNLNNCGILPESFFSNNHLGNGFSGRQLAFLEVVECAQWLSDLQKRTVPVEEIFKMLGTSSLFVLRMKRAIIGLISWKTGNFITLLSDFTHQAESPPSRTRNLLKFFESYSRRHLCEVVFVSSATDLDMDSQKKYQYVMPEMIHHPSWKSWVTLYIAQDTPVYFRPL